jgi:hypothetical protein
MLDRIKFLASPAGVESLAIKRQNKKERLAAKAHRTKIAGYRRR